MILFVQLIFIILPKIFIILLKFFIILPKIFVLNLPSKVIFAYF